MTNKVQPKTTVNFLPYQHNQRKISDKQLHDLEQWLRELGDLSGVVHDLNSNQIVGGNQRSKVFDIKNCEVVIEHRLKAPDEQGTVALGYVIWEKKRYNYRQVRWTKEQCDRANIIANKSGGAWDWDTLSQEFDSDMLRELGFDDEYMSELQEGLERMSLSEGASNDSSEETQQELKPLKMVRVLLSFPLDTAMQVSSLIEQIQQMEGVEVDYGAN